MAVPDEEASSPTRGRPPMKKSPWTREEDALLREQVRLHGARTWEVISAAVPGRNAKSCRLRWCQHLSPAVDAARPFTPREDAAVLALQRRYPNKWATIAGYLPGRTDNAIKNRWNSVLRKQQQQQQPQEQNRTTTTLALFRLAHGDVRTTALVPPPVITPTTVEGDAQGGSSSCLNLFPLASGDIVSRSDAANQNSAAAPMDVDSARNEHLTQLRLFSLETSTAARLSGRWMLQAVRAP